MCRPCGLGLYNRCLEGASWENQILNESVLCRVKGARASRNGMEPGLGTQRRPPPGRVTRVRVEGGEGSAQLNRREQNSQAKERTTWKTQI